MAKLLQFDEEARAAYLYNAAANQYVAVPCYVDANGFVHVEYATGGTIVITSAPLALR